MQPTASAHSQVAALSLRLRIRSLLLRRILAVRPEHRLAIVIRKRASTLLLRARRHAASINPTPAPTNPNLVHPPIHCISLLDDTQPHRGSPSSPPPILYPLIPCLLAILHPMPPRSATTPRLLIRSSSIHAAGCYTLDPIRRGRRVLEYDGPRITKAARRRALRRPPRHLPLRLRRQGDVIDGFGTAMFLNHSCAPNCETEDARRPRLHPRHPRHRRRRRTRLRVQPLRLRRRQRRLLLRRPPLPRHHVLRRRSQTPGPPKSAQAARVSR